MTELLQKNNVFPEQPNFMFLLLDVPFTIQVFNYSENYILNRN
jgi:hypothetical protein